MPAGADDPERPSKPRPARRAQETGAQARIKAAVIGVIAHDGFPALSVKSICKRAGVSVAAFHHHWATAEDALADALDERTRLLRLPDTGAVIADLAAYMQGYLDACSDPEFAGFMFRLMAQFALDPGLAQRLQPDFASRRRDNRMLIERAIARGEIPRHTDPEVVMNKTLRTVVAWMGSGARPSRAELELVAQRLIATGRLH